MTVLNYTPAEAMEARHVTGLGPALLPFVVYLTHTFETMLAELRMNPEFLQRGVRVKTRMTEEELPEFWQIIEIQRENVQRRVEYNRAKANEL